jgi:prepilin-type N-terminal cleavage/methylation domain-containing protein
MLNKLRSKSRKNEGFTLIELVVVVIILGILAVALVPGVLGKVQEARESRYLSDVDAIATGARMYYVENNEWPELADLEPYGIDSDIQDPWGGVITVTPVGSDLEIKGANAPGEPKIIKAPTTATPNP